MIVSGTTSGPHRRHAVRTRGGTIVSTQWGTAFLSHHKLKRTYELCIPAASRVRAVQTPLGHESFLTTERQAAVCGEQRRGNTALTTPSEVNLPAGATRTLTDHPLGVSVRACQWSDGSLDDGGILSAPGIAIHDVDAGRPLNSDLARELAAALLEAAAEFDSWVAGRTAALRSQPPMLVGS